MFQLPHKCAYKLLELNRQGYAASVPVTCICCSLSILDGWSSMTCLPLHSESYCTLCSWQYFVNLHTVHTGCPANIADVVLLQLPLEDPGSVNLKPFCC